MPGVDHGLCIRGGSSWYVNIEDMARMLSEGLGRVQVSPKCFFVSIYLRKESESDERDKDLRMVQE